MDLNQTIGLRIRMKRMAHGMTYRDLADKAGISVAYAHQIENGGGAISVEVLTRIAAALGLKSIDWFTEKLHAPYGLCPHCGQPGEKRGRRPNGNDTCGNGHVYPSASSVGVGVAENRP